MQPKLILDSQMQFPAKNQLATDYFLNIPYLCSSEAVTSDSRLTEDSMSFICMVCESSSLSTVLARLLIW